MAIIDATDLIAGRLASVVAKKAQLGEDVHIVNSEKAVISGNRRFVIDRYTTRMHRGEPFHGPNYPKMPDMFLKRIIRGMLPHRQYKGIVAFRRIKCHIGMPAEFVNQKVETIESANMKKLPNPKYIMLSDLCKQMGARI